MGGHTKDFRRDCMRAIRETFEHTSRATQTLQMTEKAFFLSTNPGVSSKYACPTGIKRPEVTKDGAVLVEVSVHPDVVAKWDASRGPCRRKASFNEQRRGMYLMRDDLVADEYF